MPDNAKIKSYKDFSVYQKAFSLSVAVHKASLDFPQIEQFALASQIRKASKSICANLAEGYFRSKYSPADFKRFISIAIGSADEMQVWLDYCLALGYLPADRCDALGQDYNEIAKMLVNLYQSVDLDFHKQAA